MTDRWFRIPVTQTDDPDVAKNVPKYVDSHSGVEGYSGNLIGESPRFIVRVFGTTDALDDITSQTDVTELTASEAGSHLGVSDPDQSFVVQ